MKQRWIRMLLSGILTAGLLLAPGAIYAADDMDAAADLDAKAGQTLQMLRTTDPFAYRGEEKAFQAMENAEAYPAQFDLRNVDGKNYVTPVKLQNPFGTCWGFAAVAAAESSVLGSGIAQADGYDANTLDFSEKHLVNFVFTPLADEENPQNGEGLYFMDKNMSLEDKLNIGGFTFYATSLFSSGIGPDLESRDPVLEYHGANKDTEKRKYDGKWIDFCYSDEDDWSVPGDWRFTQSYVLKESYVLPSPVKWTSDKVPKYEYDPAGTAAIKEQLMNLRAVSVSFHADTSMPNQESEGKYISKNWAHYTYKGEMANHGVTIVGWDDNYDKSNFVEGHQPPENGAWLVKNSWGSGEEGFPNRGGGNWGMLNEKGQHTGYFWLSYYDQSLGQIEAMAFDKSNVNKSYILSQHDYLPANQVMSIDRDKETRMANVFKADVCERLEQIACMTSAPGTTVDYQVYLLPPGHNDPEDGILVTSGSTQFQYGGYHKIDIEPQIIQRGQYYSIIITQKTPEGKYNVNASSGYSKTLAQVFQMPFYSKAVINPGESYVKTDGKWKDFSNKNVISDTLGGFFVTMQVDNFPIRGFCTPVDNFYLSVVTGNIMTLGLGDQVTGDNVIIRFKGDAEKLPEDTEIRWEASKGSEKFFTMTPNAADSSRCTVTPVAMGTGYIMASNADTGTQIIRVDVKSPNPLKISGKTASVRYAGLKKKSQRLDVSKVIKFSNKGQGTLTYSLDSAKKKGKDFITRFFMNEKTGKVSIKKGTPKGTYDLVVQVRAAGNQSYLPGRSDITYRIRIK